MCREDVQSILSQVHTDFQKVLPLIVLLGHQTSTIAKDFVDICDRCKEIQADASTSTDSTTAIYDASNLLNGKIQQTLDNLVALSTAMGSIPNKAVPASSNCNPHDSQPSASMPLPHSHSWDDVASESGTDITDGVLDSKPRAKPTAAKTMLIENMDSVVAGMTDVVSVNDVSFTPFPDDVKAPPAAAAAARTADGQDSDSSKDTLSSFDSKDGLPKEHMDKKIKMKTFPHRQMCSSRKLCVGPVGGDTYFGRKCKKCDGWCHWACVPPTDENLKRKTLTCWNCHWYKVPTTTRFKQPRDTEEFFTTRMKNEELAKAHTVPPGILPFQCFNGNLVGDEALLPFFVPSNFDYQKIADFNRVVYAKLTNDDIMRGLNLDDEQGVEKWLFRERLQHQLPTTDIVIRDQAWLSAQSRQQIQADAPIASRIRRLKTKVSSSSQQQKKKKRTGAHSSIKSSSEVGDSEEDSEYSGSTTDPAHGGRKIHASPATKKKKKQDKSKRKPKDLRIVVLPSDVLPDVSYQLAIVRDGEIGRSVTTCERMSCVQTGDEDEMYIDMLVWVEEKANAEVVYVGEGEKDLVLHQLRARDLIDLRIDDGRLRGRLSARDLLLVFVGMCEQAKCNEDLRICFNEIDRISVDMLDQPVENGNPLDGYCMFLKEAHRERFPDS